MKFRLPIIFLFILLAAVSGYYVFQLKFSFNFEQFFPEGDEDLEFFQDFISNFETDDNFMLIAVRRDSGVFEQRFLEQFHDFTLRTRSLPFVEESQSLTKFGYPVKTPFAITTLPAIHIDQPERYANDRQRLLQDERFVNNLINEEGTALVVYLKMVNSIQLEQASVFMDSLSHLIQQYDFAEYHYLGRPNFQTQLVAMQKREITVSAIVSGILVSLVMFFLFRRPWGIALALFSIGLGMLLFFGLLSMFGRELNAMAALYPVLMIIVGTSDVIHIMTKYIDELRKGKTRAEAVTVTIKEIGLATLLTSVTTAIGFASLLTSRIGPIRDFGINAAIGVLVAYVTVILFTTSVLSYFRTEQLVKLGRGQAFWENLMARTNQFTLQYPRQIAIGSIVVLAFCGLGIANITTNYSIINNMPIGEKITEDFVFFEEQMAGFRPIEFAIYVQDGYRATDYEVVKTIGQIEDYLRQFPAIKGIGSITAVYKSINQMYNNNRPEAYRLPDDKARFDQYKRMADKIPAANVNVLVSEDGTKARISSRIQDIGADTIKQIGQQIDQWIVANTDTSMVKVVRTGTGVIIDKNSEYVRASLIQGLGLAVLIVSLLMALLFRNWRMLVIALVPNVFPLLVAGALLGYLGIDLEAGISIVFAVVFGIAVDDTIHFLSKYKLMRNKGHDVDESIRVTFLETGKAITLTSIILFFGFLVMLFSIHPPSVTVGLLISATLLSAVLADLLVIPVMLRWMHGQEMEDN